MEQYIPKSALVAEIKSRIDINETCQKISGNNEFYRGAIDEAKEILSIINTLEVKEVDLDWQDIYSILYLERTVQHEFGDHEYSNEDICQEVLKRFKEKKENG